MAQKADHFSWADYLVFALLLLLSCGTGLYYTFCGKKKNKTLEEYLMADRRMFLIPTCISTVVTLFSAVLLLGVPAEMYVYGTEFWIYGFGMMLGFLIAALMLVPLLYPLKLTSSYKYLELRFQSKAAKLTGSILLLISQIFDMGIVFYGPATALEGVTDFPAWGSIICFGLVATFYTALGGIKAVIWTDTIHAAIILAGLIALLVVGSNEVGGFEQVWKINKLGGRINFLNFSGDPTTRHTFWSLLCGGLFSWLARAGIMQQSVQRYVMVPSLNKGRLTVLMALPCAFILFTISCLSGMVVYAYFAECDPLSHPNKQERLRNSNQLLPYFVMQVLGWPGFPGLFLSVLYSFALSTISSILNAGSAVIWEDFLEPCFGQMSERRKMIAIKILVVIFGAVGVGMSFLVKFIGGILIKAAITLSSGTASPLLGMFLLGGLFPCCNWLGAIIGGITGLMMALWINFGAFVVKPYNPKLMTSIAGCMSTYTYENDTTTMTLLQNVSTAVPNGAISDSKQLKGIEQLYGVSYLLIPFIGVATTVVVGLLVSLISAPFIEAPKPNEIDKKYLMSVCHCCFKGRVKNQQYEDKDVNKKQIPIINNEMQHKLEDVHGKEIINDAYHKTPL